MYSHAPFSLCSWVEQYRLYVKMSLPFYQLSPFYWKSWFVCTLDLIAKHSVFIYCRTNNEISCFLFNKNVTISISLVKSSWSSNSKHWLPCIRPCQTTVKFVCEFHCVLVDFKFWVKVKISTWFASQVTKCLDIFELVFTCCENEEIDRNLYMGKFRSCVAEVNIAWGKLCVYIVCILCFYLKHRMPTGSMRNLKH